MVERTAYDRVCGVLRGAVPENNLPFQKQVGGNPFDEPDVIQPAYTCQKWAKRCESRPTFKLRSIPRRSYRVGSSTGKSVVTMAKMSSPSHTGTDRVTIQISPPPASK